MGNIPFSHRHMQLPFHVMHTQFTVFSAAFQEPSCVVERFDIVPILPSLSE